MKIQSRQFFRKAVVATALFCMTTQPVLAAVLSLAQEPLILGVPPAPKLMLTISKDQELYKKGYNDYSDLDGDGVLDLTYKHAIEYYGYFDPTKCYDYDKAANRFEPKKFGGNPDATTGVRPNAKCDGKQWSGNFLNWVTMSRMDAIRKLLYGGLRSQDDAFAIGDNPKNNVTVLERAFVPADAHAWAKWYDGADLKELTPYDLPNVKIDKNNKLDAGFRIQPDSTQDGLAMVFKNKVKDVDIGSQVRITRSSNASINFTAAVVSIENSGKTLRLRIAAEGISAGAVSNPTYAADTDFDIENLSASGMTFCNVTDGSQIVGDKNAKSQTNDSPPLMRVATGNFQLWNANERVQCLWGENRDNLQGGFADRGGLRSNGNQASLSGINASAESPYQKIHAPNDNVNNNGEYWVRVRVCVDDKDLVDFSAGNNKEECHRYTNGNLKPRGLLQQYGEDGRIHFGLMTGSYAKNTSGGVLRKNAGTIADEINLDDGRLREKNTDGTFRYDIARPRGGMRTNGSAESPPGIINTLNYMRIYGYQYAGSERDSYIGASGDNCTYQLTEITANQCTSWGNPMSEVFFEAIRYFAGKTASAGFTYTPSGSKDNELGLPLASFSDPLSASNYCANTSVLMFNSSVTSSEMIASGASAKNFGAASAADINAAGKTIRDLTNAVGVAEGIKGNKFLVGGLMNATGVQDFELCTAKTVTEFGDITGVCPEGATTGGSYLIAGVAHHAKTNRIRTDITPRPNDPNIDRVFKVQSYGIQLSSNTPVIEIPVDPADKTKKIIITPIYRLDLGAQKGGGALVDLKYVSLTPTTGKVYVNWEDSEQGGDFDQDMWGTIEWKISGTTITVTTNAISASSNNPQGFGYSISGTQGRDGPHFHSGIYQFNYSEPIAGVKGCNKCDLVFNGGQVGAQSQDYTIAGTPSDLTLNDPLWYMAKYGGFDDANKNSKLDGTEWDQIGPVVNGKMVGDGVPDSYFLVTNPLRLVTAMRDVFSRTADDSAGSSSATNSTSLQTINQVFRARFIPGPQWWGDVIATTIEFKDDPVNKGAVLPVASTAWKAAEKLAQRTSERQILAWDDATRDGIPFRWGNLSNTAKAALRTNPVSGVNDGLGQERVDWVRGDASKETPAGVFRARSRSTDSIKNLGRLGDIVNSDPAYVGIPNDFRTERSYATFRNSNKDRTPMVYVGANDGMLHGFNANNGEEVFAYVPGPVIPHLPKLTDPRYTHRYFVDGSPIVADIQLEGDKGGTDATGTWRTVLVGALGAGGQGLYALDVTNPGALTEANASRVVMWEFTDKDDPDLGYVTGRPLIRKVYWPTSGARNGERWVAIFSGGYNSMEADGSVGNGGATLFIVALDGPQDGKWDHGVDYIKINTGAGAALGAAANGLAPPFAADVDSDGKVDYVYAGDLFGNFWKFDLTTGGDANFSPLLRWAEPLAAPPLLPAKNRVVLFQALDRNGRPQAITAQAEGMLHPDRSRGGFILTVGTGKWLEPIDAQAPFSNVVQSYYGIWDKNDAKPVSGQTVVPNRARLQEQKLSELGSGQRSVTAEIVDWASKLGWFLDFPNSPTNGERIAFRPLLISARLIFTTLIPSDHPCTAIGSSFMMIIDPGTGGRVNSIVLDRDGNGILNSSDQITIGGAQAGISGLASTVGITPTPVVVRGGVPTSGSSTASKVFGAFAPYVAGAEGAMAFTVLNGTTGVGAGSVGGPPAAFTGGQWIGLRANSGRVSWREIVN